MLYFLGKILNLAMVRLYHEQMGSNIQKTYFKITKVHTKLSKYYSFTRATRFTTFIITTHMQVNASADLWALDVCIS